MANEEQVNIIVSELVKAANEAKLVYNKTKDKTYQEKANRYNAIAIKLSEMTFDGGGGGGATALSDLTDVEIPSPSNGDLIQYDSGSSMWVQYTPTYLSSTGSYSNPSWLTSLAWSKITGEPTTLSGYGITDGENVTNKSTDVTLGGASPSSTYYTTEYAVKLYVDNAIAAAQAGIPTFEIDMFANYKVYQTDDAGLTIYVGKIKASSGAWLIEKYVDDGTGDLTVTYANVSNNGSYTTPTTAWTNHTTLTYAAIDTLSGI